MSILIAILGLALLIVIYELGHFYGALVGHAPAGFLDRVRAAAREGAAERHRLRVPCDPLGAT